MEPNYKEMFEELAAKIETEYRHSCESLSVFTEKYIANGNLCDRLAFHHLIGVKTEAYCLKLTVDRIEKKNGLK